MNKTLLIIILSLIIITGCSTKDYTKGEKVKKECWDYCLNGGERFSSKYINDFDNCLHSCIVKQHNCKFDFWDIEVYCRGE